MNWQYEKEEKNGKAKWLMILLLLIILLLGSVIIMLLLRENCGEAIAETTASNENPDGGVGLVIDSDAENNSLYESNNVEEQGVVISGWEAIAVPANQKEVAVDFYNPIENQDMYYLTFELRLYNSDEQSYEVLYASGLVEPGKHINRITFSRELDEGVYEAVLHVQPYRMNEEKTLTNNADMKIKLIVR